MKKILLLLMTTLSLMASETIVYNCTYYSFIDRKLDVTTILESNEVLPLMVVKQEDVKIRIDNKIYSFYYKQAQGEDALDVYQAKNGNVLGIYKDLENGVRFVTQDNIFDLVDCVVITKVP